MRELAFGIVNSFAESRRSDSESHLHDIAIMIISVRHFLRVSVFTVMPRATGTMPVTQ